MKLNEKLIKLRKENGLSQEDFGNKINVSRQAVSKWENGESKPDIDKVQEIVKQFNISFDYLLNDEIDEKENIAKSENASIKKKKNILKTTLKILLILLIIYLVFCIYKFIAFYRFYLIANSFSEENYWVNQSFSSYSDFNGRFKCDYFTEEVGNTRMTAWYRYENNEPILDENGVFSAQSIDFIDADKKTYYSLNYNQDKKMYIYNDRTKDFINDEELAEAFNLEENLIKETTLALIPSGFKEIFLASINPMYYYVSIFNREIRYISLTNSAKSQVVLNNDYQVEIMNVKTEYDGSLSSYYSYDYVQDHFKNRKEPLEKYKDKILFEE